LDDSDSSCALPLSDLSWIIDRIVKVANSAVPSTPKGLFVYQSHTRHYPTSPSGIFTLGASTQAFATKQDAPVLENVNQVLVNEYIENQGISSHIDDPDAFGAVIACVSLGSPIWMTLTRVSRDGISLLKNASTGASEDHLDGNERESVQVYLEPGSLLVLKGPARYEYTHGITKARWIPVLTLNASQLLNAIEMNDEDQENVGSVPVPNCWFEMRKRDDRFRRLSLTIRKLLDQRKRIVMDSEGWVSTTRSMSK
jgi:alkylated DNA repair dioxygenase AlkB